MDDRSYQKSFILDMDGVVYNGPELVGGAKEFVNRLIHGNYKFLFLTNNSYHTPLELKEWLFNLGIDVTEDHFYTSAMATASFLMFQRPDGCSAYVIGGRGVFEEKDDSDALCRMAEGQGLSVNTFLLESADFVYAHNRITFYPISRDNTINGCCPIPRQRYLVHQWGHYFKRLCGFFLESWSRTVI